MDIVRFLRVNLANYPIIIEFTYYKYIECYIAYNNKDLHMLTYNAKTCDENLILVDVKYNYEIFVHILEFFIKHCMFEVKSIGNFCFKVFDKYYFAIDYENRIFTIFSIMHKPLKMYFNDIDYDEIDKFISVNWNEIYI